MGPVRTHAPASHPKIDEKAGLAYAYHTKRLVQRHKRNAQQPLPKRAGENPMLWVTQPSRVPPQSTTAAAVKA